MRGREAGWDFNMRIRDSFEWVSIEVEHVDAGADKVLGHPRAVLRGVGSGAEVEYRTMVRRHGPSGEDPSHAVFADRADALEVAGLSE